VADDLATWGTEWCRVEVEWSIEVLPGGDVGVEP